MQKTDYLKKAYTKFTNENLENIISYLKEIGGKPLTTKCKRQNTLKTSWSDKENKLRARCHVQNASEYLDFIKKSIVKEQLQIVIADVIFFVRFLDLNENTSFVLSTNTQVSAIQFDNAKRLFYNHQIRKQYQNNYSVDLLVLYALRLSLESRVRGFLGVDYATLSRGNKIGLSTFIKIAKKIKSVVYSKEIDWIEIDWVNNWLNHHMHRHIRPYPWVIHQAIEILKPLIDPKEPLIKSGRVIYSYYSATYVNDESALKNEIELHLKELYPEVKIRWLNKREILKK